MQNQHRVPLFEALSRYRGQVRAPLHVPGHKLGAGAPAPWHNLTGSDMLALDLTEAPGLDDLHAPSGVIAEAQHLAADAFGARRSFFLVGGTTAGLHALILAACRPGEVLAVPRFAHRSILGAMILAGVRPCWVRVCFHEELDIATHLDIDSLRAAAGDSSAMILVNPTYHGTTGNLAAEIDLGRERGVPVLVDEAHGTHFHFHPELPASALSLGADAVVQSMHKTGGSLTQSSICHLGPDHRLSETRVQEMLRLVQSTSPSYILMASLDLARRNLALHGHSQWDRALQLAAEARTKLSAVRGIRVHPTADPTKLLIDVRGRGISGFQAADWLWSRGVAVEVAGLCYVLGVLTPGDTPETVSTLVEAASSLPQGDGTPPRPPEPPWPEVVIPPREAYLGGKESVPLEKALGRIAAEMVAPYPPGIPVVAPGEQLTGDVVGYLQFAVRAGYRFQGPVDPTLNTIQVVKE